MKSPAIGAVNMNKRGKIVNVKCENCGKELYVKDTNIRQKMFCTIKCMDSYSEEISMMEQLIPLRRLLSPNHTDTSFCITAITFLKSNMNNWF